MLSDKQLRVLQAEWAEGGFFWNVRDGIFREDDFHRALAMLKSFDLSGDSSLSPIAVRLVWYIPHYLPGRRSRCT